MPTYVTGIAPTQDVGELEKALGKTGLEHDKFVVITKDEPTEEHDDSFLNFIHAVPVEHLLLSDHGSDVPGINPASALNNYIAHPHVVRHLGNLPIPDDEVDNYNDAIDDGRTVVAYPVDGGSQASIESAFHKAGLAHVKAF